MDTKLKAEPWVERTGSEPTKAQKERKHKSRVQQKMRQRENRKLVARGEEGKSKTVDPTSTSTKTH